jgi:hypothetical protein
VKNFEYRCPKQYEALIECSAFVNCRRLEVGGTPLEAVPAVAEPVSLHLYRLNGFISNRESFFAGDRVLL